MGSSISSSLIGSCTLVLRLQTYCFGGHEVGLDHPPLSATVAATTSSSSPWVCTSWARMSLRASSANHTCLVLRPSGDRQETIMLVTPRFSTPCWYCMTLIRRPKINPPSLHFTMSVHSPSGPDDDSIVFPAATTLSFGAVASWATPASPVFAPGTCPHRKRMPLRAVVHLLAPSQFCSFRATPWAADPRAHWYSVPQYPTFNPFFTLK
mmetsp:Transcript_83133/g.222161  ORF Transcript_83133/g.222161 Transcript_83133/m.222161 type:complete len:209 (-) Transcript_83133:365-991(-)